MKNEKIGYKLLEYVPGEKDITLSHNLTEDSLNARLHVRNIASPVMIQYTTDKIKNELKKLLKKFKLNITEIAKYAYGDFILNFKDFIKKNSYSTYTQNNEELNVKNVKNENICPSYGTALQLGLVETRGIPSLLDHSVSEHATMRDRDYIKNLIMIPKPLNIIKLIQNVCKKLINVNEALPTFSPKITLNRIIQVKFMLKY